MHRPFRFAPPPIAPAAVLRPRLLEVLACRFEVRLTAVEAGAGLGKTTLLTQAFAENRLAGGGLDVWLTCGPEDSSASPLLAGLLAGLGVPDAGAPSTADVCAAVWAAAPMQVCLVVDDAHHVDPGSEGEAVLRRLVDDLPENGHLLVAARRLPALGRSRLLAQGRAVELDGDALRLDDDEAAALAAAHGLVGASLAAAGGWPALAELFARTGGASAERFVQEEVLAPMAEADRRAFAVVVAVGGADGEALDALVDHPFDRDALVGLPLVNGDGRGGVWPHPLWEDLLRRRLSVGAVTAARRRLGEVLLARGDNGVAFELLAAAGDWPTALRAVFAAANDQRQPPWRDQMARWRGLVPPELSAAPEVRYLDAMIERARDPWSDVGWAAFLDAVHGFNGSGEVASGVAAGVRAAHSAWLRGDRDFLDRMAAHALRLIDAGVPISAIHSANRLTVADIEGAWDEMLALCDRMGDVEPRLRHFEPLFRVIARLGLGEADAATEAADAAVAAAIPVEPAAGTGWAFALPGFVAWARGDLAALIADRPKDPGSRHSIAERIPSLALAAVVAAHLGDTAEADAHLATIDQLAADVGDVGFVEGFRAVVVATIASARGDEAAAEAVLEATFERHELAPAGAGRAVVWLPSLPWLASERGRRFLDGLPAGPSRRRNLGPVAALVAARHGTTPPLDVLVDPGTLLTALPLPLAIELVVRAVAGGVDEAGTAVSALAELAPGATRAALRTLTESTHPAVRRAAQALLGSVPIPPPHRVRIELLGPARLLVDGQPSDDANWRRARVRQLVCALVVHREIRRARLGALLWPEFDEEGVSGNLRMTLSYVQRLLEPHRAKGDAPWFLQQEAGLLRLRADGHLTVDAWELDDHLDRAAAAAEARLPSVELEHLLAAIRLWRGEALDDVAGEEWADPFRTRLLGRLVGAAVRAGDLLVAAGRAREAVAAGEVAVAADPYSEEAHRVLVDALLHSGDIGAAAGAYAAATRALADLSVTPSPALASLGDRLRGAGPPP